MIPAPGRQRGAALLIVMLIVVLATLAGGLRALNHQSLLTARQRITTDALTEAKAALIAYAVTYPESDLGGSPIPVFVPGHLPCPDGVACGSKGVSVIGPFPWKKLGLPPLRDADGNCLWYAVSGNFKTSNKADLVNPDTPGQFAIFGDDTSAAPLVANAAAVIFSPGPPLPGQARSNDGSDCGGDVDPQHFLDSLAGINNAVINASPGAITPLIAGRRSEAFNDRLVWITPDEIFATGVDRRSDLDRSLFDPAYATNGTPALAQRIAECLVGGFVAPQTLPDKRLPWAAPIAVADSPPNTFRNTSFVDAVNQRVGRVPYVVTRSVASINRNNFTTTHMLHNCTSTTDTSCRLLRIENCPAGWQRVAGYPTTSDSPHGWWDKWKDHFFYAVAEDFQPGATPSACAAPTTPGSKCLYVDGKGPYAAVVIYADRALSGQTRANTVDKNNPANYLENENRVAIQANNGSDLNFGLFHQTGNDKFVCIRPDFIIDPLCQ